MLSSLVFEVLERRRNTVSARQHSSPMQFFRFRIPDNRKRSPPILLLRSRSYQAQKSIGGNGGINGGSGPCLRCPVLLVGDGVAGFVPTLLYMLYRHLGTEVRKGLPSGRCCAQSGKKSHTRMVRMGRLRKTIRLETLA